MYALEADYSDQIEFLQINTDDPDDATKALMQEHGFRSGTPHLLLYGSDGEIVRQWFGLFTRDQIEPLFIDELSSWSR